MKKNNIFENFLFSEENIHKLAKKVKKQLRVSKNFFDWQYTNYEDFETEMTMVLEFYYKELDRMDLYKIYSFMASYDGIVNTSIKSGKHDDGDRSMPYLKIEFTTK